MTLLYFHWHRFPRSECCFHRREPVSLTLMSLESPPLLWECLKQTSMPCVYPWLPTHPSFLRWDKNLFFLFFFSCRLAKRLCPSLWNRPPMWKLQGCFGPTWSRAGPWGHRGCGRAGSCEQKKPCLDSSVALGEGMGHSQRAAPEKKKQCRICTYIPIV